MNTNYRGPYFRTGIDGAGNYWELDSGRIASAVRNEQRRLVSKPIGWELRRKPSKQALDQMENFGMTNLAQPVMSTKTELPIETHVTKEYLKDMLIEIWNETNGTKPLPNLKQDLESFDDAELNKAQGPDGVNQWKDSDFEAEAKGQEVKLPKNNGLNDVGLQINLTEENRTSPANFFQNYKSSREEKMRTFECFRKMSCEPPKPSSSSVRFASFETIDCPTQVRSSGMKKRSTKSRSKVNPTVSTSQSIDENNVAPGQGPLQGQTLEFGLPGRTQFQSYLLPQQSVFRPSFQRFQKSEVNDPRGVQRSREQSLHSLMIVKKVPLVDGFFNDMMLPPVVPPEEPKRVPKKRFDAWRPLNWAHHQHQHERAVMRQYIRQYQDSTPAQGQMKVKGQPEMQSPTPNLVPLTKPKKPVHPSKQFPVHVPGPKKDNMFIGKYVDSETDLIRRDIQIKSKVDT